MISQEILAASSKLSDQLIAVVDIGSNSVRLVVHDLNSRVLIPYINEKVFCAMGRDLSTTGRLDPDGRQLAITALERFRALIEISRVSRVEAVATAAVRDASDGEAFRIHAEERLGAPIRVLDGDEEARYSALGVIAGIPDADGIVGDLGGGSLELIEVHDKKIGNRATLPLGPLRLLGMELGNKASREYIDKELKRVAWIRRLSKPRLYLVGGSWRSLARLHLRQAGARHLIKIPHQYTLRAREALELRQFVPGKKQLDRMEVSDRQRREGLVMAALVLERFIECTDAGEIVVSAYGLREGIVAEIQGLEKLSRDPLIADSEELCREMGRDLSLPSELVQFTAPLFPDETATERQLRTAACWLADIAWRVHPEYRANVAFWRVLGEQFAGIDHEGRAFLATTLYERYPGGDEPEDVKNIRSALGERPRANARLLGRALRLAMTLCGGTHGTLGQCSLVVKKGGITLDMPHSLRVLLDDTVDKRLAAINDAVERGPGRELLAIPR